MEIPRLGVKSELQLLVYTTVTAMWDPGRVCDLHHSSQQSWTEARYPTHNLMVAIRFISAEP